MDEVGGGLAAGILAGGQGAYVLAAYAVTLVVLGALVLVSLDGLRRSRRRLAEIERQAGGGS